MLREKLAESGAGQKNGFRWRSHEISRIEGFTDAVLAFAITLLVVSLEVPKSFTELMEVMHGFFGFALSFTLLFYIWFSQYNFFRRYGLEDGITILLNALLMFVVLFYVYPLKFLATLLAGMFNHGQHQAEAHAKVMHQMIADDQVKDLFIVYGAGYAAVFLIFALMFAHAWRKREELALSPLEAWDTRQSIQEYSIHVVVGLISVALAMSPYAGLAGMAYVSLTFLQPGHGMIMGRKRRKLESA